MRWEKHSLPVVKPRCRHDRLEVKQPEGQKHPHLECVDCGTEWRPVPVMAQDMPLYQEGFSLRAVFGAPVDQRHLLLEPDEMLDGDALPVI